MTYLAVSMFVLVVVAVVVASLCGLTIALYGDFAAFVEAWRAWARGIFSLEILDGGAFPPPRLAFWLMLAVVIVSGECRMMP
jgi:hypothetical protein